MQFYVVSVLAPDQPGIIETLSDTISQHQGNWLASNFCRLSGQFAGIAEFSVDKIHCDKLLNAINALNTSQMKLHITQGHADQQTDLQEARLTITGNDQIGIVKQISAVLAAQKVNVTELSSVIKSAPNWGSPIFEAQITVSAPTEFDFDDIQEALENIANDLIIDIDLDKSAA